jgi:hypothetical protein
MRAHFRIGDVLPVKMVVAQFLTGLAIIINDVTLVASHMLELHDRADRESGLNTYYLYLTCAYYREAAKYLDRMIDVPEVSSFLERLSPDGRTHLALLRDSVRPWDTSFVKEKLEPVRNFVFHYTPFQPKELAPNLAAAADIESWIEMGSGSYVENRYAFADEVLSKYVIAAWGDSTEEWTQLLEKMRDLVLALTYFGHEAIALRMQDHGIEKFRVERP